MKPRHLFRLLPNGIGQADFCARSQCFFGNFLVLCRILPRDSAKYVRLFIGKRGVFHIDDAVLLEKPMLAAKKDGYARRILADRGMEAIRPNIGRGNRHGALWRIKVQVDLLDQGVFVEFGHRVKKLAESFLMIHQALQKTVTFDQQRIVLCHHFFPLKQISHLSHCRRNFRGNFLCSDSPALLVCKNSIAQKAAIAN